MTTGGIVQGIKAIGLVMASTGMVTALLTVFFNWRRRLLAQIRGISKGGFS